MEKAPVANEEVTWRRDVKLLDELREGFVQK